MSSSISVRKPVILSYIIPEIFKTETQKVTFQTITCNTKYCIIIKYEIQFFLQFRVAIDKIGRFKRFLMKIGKGFLWLCVGKHESFIL